MGSYVSKVIFKDTKDVDHNIIAKRRARFVLRVLVFIFY